MAASNRHFVTPQYRFISGELNNSVTSDPMFEFELNESDVWNNVSISLELRKPVPSPRISKRSSSVAVNRKSVGGTPTSVPVSVPDWSKKLKEYYTENRRRDSDDDNLDDDYNSGEEWGKVRVRKKMMGEGESERHN
ncbi:putative senescence regulator S40 [Helianthus annuus]|nr:putative senescence regulator S40 [Helianthus annuus]